ncbi:hypothetical protein L6164_013622 [Bauhinia variegata]|uniref:Uncharacterized protein n=1 Tax=Bauhinia variegata TaxID=167791 RepID=A0ACB9NG56_BAUVA|nr:hypothetical protein L6164_013622 [Bauhinia variegata]
MPQRMAVTYADLEPSCKRTDLSRKTVAFFIVVTILLGLFCFILCLMAEATRSEATWVSTDDKGKGGKSCAYSGSGKVPLLCCVCAFVGLAIVMLVGHIYMLIAVTKMPETPLITWDPASAPPKSLSWQLGFFYVATWICFAVGEVLLLAGITVESGHLQNWDKPKASCLIIKQGLLSAAGVFALITVFLAIGLYLTALHAQRIYQETVNVRRQVLETSALYSSPPTIPQRQFMTVARENPMSTHNHQQGHLHQLLRKS